MQQRDTRQHYWKKLGKRDEVYGEDGTEISLRLAFTAGESSEKTDWLVITESEYQQYASEMLERRELLWVQPNVYKQQHEEPAVWLCWKFSTFPHQ